MCCLDSHSTHNRVRTSYELVRIYLLAGGEGIEPSITEPESVVLPLDHPPRDGVKTMNDSSFSSWDIGTQNPC